jgi:hypothetical protein
MRAVAIAALALVLVTGASEGRQVVAERTRPDVIYASAGHKANGPCSEDQWLRITPKEWTPELVRGLVRCAVDRWPVPGGAPKANAVADCESSWYPFAYYAGNYGVFQIRSWASHVHTYLKPRWFSDNQWDRIRGSERGAYLARANVLLAIRWASRVGWSAWSCD